MKKKLFVIVLLIFLFLLPSQVDAQWFAKYKTVNLIVYKAGINPNSIRDFIYSELIVNESVNSIVVYGVPKFNHTIRVEYDTVLIEQDKVSFSELKSLLLTVNFFDVESFERTLIFNEEQKQFKISEFVALKLVREPTETAVFIPNSEKYRYNKQDAFCYKIKYAKKNRTELEKLIRKTMLKADSRRPAICGSYYNGINYELSDQKIKF